MKELTKIELQAIKLLSSGMTVEAIADMRGVSVNAVYQTIRGCKDKIGLRMQVYVGNTEQLCVIAERIGLLNE